MKKIPLSGQHGAGKFTLVDDEDYPELLFCAWHYFNGYARSSYSINGKKFTRHLHRFILDAEPGQIVDHINGDRSDNRRANLRFVSFLQNSLNRVAAPSRTGVKGVYYYDRTNSFLSNIKINGVLKHLGYFKTIHEAQVAYQKVAKEHFGEYSRK